MGRSFRRLSAADFRVATMNNGENPVLSTWHMIIFGGFRHEGNARYSSSGVKKDGLHVLTSFLWLTQQDRICSPYGLVGCGVRLQVVRGKTLWKGKFKHKETLDVTRVDVSHLTEFLHSAIASSSSLVSVPHG